jgi:hypothetical protein
MTRTLTALYDSYEDAAAAIRAIEQAGMAREQISVVTRDPDDGRETIRLGHRKTNGATTGAVIGAVVGGGGCMMAGLGMVAIPGLGPVVAAGWLVAMAVGIVAGGAVGGAGGGIIGALMRSGVPKEHAHVFAEGIRRGGTLVTVRVVNDYADRMVKILRQFHPVDPNLLARSYRDTGWTGFDEVAPPYGSMPPASEQHLGDPRHLI